MKTSFSLAKLGAAALLLTSLTSCEDVLEQYFPDKNKPNTPTFPSLGQDIPFYALSGGTQLDAYSTKNPATRTGSVAISGLQSGERILAVDFRPATGQLYGVSSTNRIYVINQTTGAARAIGAGPFTPAVSGNLVGFDFNPTVDRIRLVTNTGQNLRLNPETGTVAATDGAINGVAGASTTGAAYTNNTAGATTTALYAINTQNQQLYLVNPPNDGTLVPVGSLNLNISGNGGFDIDAKTGTALGLYDVQGKPTLFSVNLSTGAARPLAEYAANLNYSGIAIPTRPVAYGTDASITSPVINTLYIFDPTTNTDVVSRTITGLEAGEGIVGLDFRPLNGQLYALGSFSRLYTINAASGAATLVAPLSSNLGVGDTGFDFNPVVDRIRIVRSGGQNLRVNPADGVAIVDGSLNPSGKGIFAAAYSNNFAGTTTTTLYDLGTVSSFSESVSTLYRQMPPNDGTLVEVGGTGQPQITGGSFDIGGTSNVGYATINIASTTSSSLATVDLQTGKVAYTTRDLLPRLRSFTVGLGF